MSNCLFLLGTGWDNQNLTCWVLAGIVWNNVLEAHRTVTQKGSRNGQSLLFQSRKSQSEVTLPGSRILFRALCSVLDSSVAQCDYLRGNKVPYCFSKILGAWLFILVVWKLQTVCLFNCSGQSCKKWHWISVRKVFSICAAEASIRKVFITWDFWLTEDLIPVLTSGRSFKLVCVFFDKTLSLKAPSLLSDPSR